MPDRYNLLKEILSFPDQIVDARELGQSIELFDPIKNVVIAGMGGSGSAGHLLKTVLYDKPINVQVIQDMKLPGWINKETLVFIISYSGDTEETLEMFASAVRQKATIVTITSGGRLLDLAKDRHKHFVKLPKRILPRNAVAYSLFAMINVLAGAGLLARALPDTHALTTVLKNRVWEEKAEQMAKKFLNKVPIIYTSEKLKGIGLRTKQMFNENAKVHAFSNTIPEQNHNEIQGFENPQARFQVLLIQDDDESHKVKKRMLATKKIIEKTGAEVTAIKLKGQSLLTKVLSAVHLTNLISYHLSQMYDIEPAKTELIEALKEM